MRTCKTIYNADSLILSINSHSLVKSHVYTQCMNLCFVPSHAVRSVAIQRRGLVDVSGVSVPLVAKAKVESHDHRMARSITLGLSVPSRPLIPGEVQEAFNIKPEGRFVGDLAAWG